MTDVRTPAPHPLDETTVAGGDLLLAQAPVDSDAPQEVVEADAERRQQEEEEAQPDATDASVGGESAPAAEGAQPAFNPSVVAPISLAELEGRDPNAATVFGLPLWGAAAIGAGVVTLGVLAATDDDDGGGGTANVAPFIISNGGGANAAISLGENGTTVTTVMAGDTDPSATITYSISGGDDADLFEINASTGALKFKNAPDFETPVDADEDNKYVVQVQASDGELSDTQTITITVRNIAEITSNGGGDTAEIDLEEGGTAVTTVTTEDTTETLVFSIVGGDDAELFNINSSTGALRFLDAPDFDDPQDEGADNVYEVIIRVGSGNLFDTQTLLITVTEAEPSAAAAAGDDTMVIAKALNESLVDTTPSAVVIADGTEWSFPEADLSTTSSPSSDAALALMWAAQWWDEGSGG